MDIYDKTERLLSEVSLATAMISPTDAYGFSPHKKHRNLWEADTELRLAGQGYGAISNLKWWQGVPVLFLRIATLRQFRLACNQVRKAEQQALTVLPEPEDYRFNGLSPYDIQARGLMELVLSSGNFLRPRGLSGKQVADLYARIILDTGRPGSLFVLSSGWFQGDFGRLLRGASLSEESQHDLARYQEAGPLPASQRREALEILAAWLRMSRIGIRLSSFDRLQSWGKLANGGLLSLYGEVWRMTDKQHRRARRRLTPSDPWISSPLPLDPWRSPDGGSPLIFYGIAADALLAAAQSVGTPTSNTATSEITESCSKTLFRYEIRLSRMYSELVRRVEGSCSEIRMVNRLDVDEMNC